MTNKKPSLADLRAKFKQKAEGKREFTRTSDVYPHWEIPENATATIRILPDLNEDNENYFYVEKLMHELSINGKNRKIPCIKMYGEKCPICELSSKHYKAAKAAGKEESTEGKYYYFKRTALMKALIIKDPIDHTADGSESPEGQVKTVQFTYQLMKLINSALANDEEEKRLEELPWDMEAGYNFLIQKTKQGQYDNYSTSAFSNRVSAIAEKYLDAVEEGRVDLATLLPENPGADKVQALLELHLGGGEEEEEESEDTPVVIKRKPVVAEVEDDELPVRGTRKPVVVESEDEEIPVRTRKPVVVESEEEEVPVRRKPAVVVSDEDEAPVRRKPVVVESEEEDEAPVIKKRKPVVEEEVEEDSGEAVDNSDEAIVARMRARRQKSAD